MARIRMAAAVLVAAAAGLAAAWHGRPSMCQGYDCPRFEIVESYGPIELRRYDEGATSACSAALARCRVPAAPPFASARPTCSLTRLRLDAFAASWIVRNFTDSSFNNAVWRGFRVSATITVYSDYPTTYLKLLLSGWSLMYASLPFNNQHRPP